MIAATLGVGALAVDKWAHSPAALKRDMDLMEARMNGFERRFDAGNERFSEKMSKTQHEHQELDRRLTRLEAFHEMNHDTPQPKGRR